MPISVSPLDPLTAAALGTERLVPPGDTPPLIKIEFATGDPDLRASIPHLAAYPDYAVELIGPAYELPPGEFNPPFDFPSFSIVGDNPITLEIWRARAWYKDSHVFAEQTWGPRIGIAGSIRGLEHAAGRADLDRAWNGLRLLRATSSRPGRPVGTGAYSGAADLETAVRRAVDTLTLRGETPTQELVAAHLGLELRWFKRLLVRHHLDWRRLIRPPR